MDKIKFEDLLGKNISKAKEFTGRDFKSNAFKKKDFEVKFYSSRDYFKKDFFGMYYNQIIIHTDNYEVIKSITIYFDKLIDREFYNSFNKEYGMPKHIQIVENRRMESETLVKDDNGKVIEHLRKNTFDLREGTFEEKPLYIIWEKENYEIKALLRQENMSQITFSVSAN